MLHSKQITKITPETRNTNSKMHKLHWGEFDQVERLVVWENKTEMLVISYYSGLICICPYRQFMTKYATPVKHLLYKRLINTYVKTYKICLGISAFFKHILHVSVLYIAIKGLFWKTHATHMPHIYLNTCGTPAYKKNNKINALQTLHARLFKTVDLHMWYVQYR